MKKNKTEETFFALVGAGLWAYSPFHGEGLIVNGSIIDWQGVYRLATEQSVLGIVLAGIEHLKSMNPNLNVPQEVLLHMIGEVQMMEQSNKEMNKFIAKLVGEMRKAGIDALLVKGQGVAQCYEKPLWRSSGDVDLLLNEDDYQKAKQFLLPLASNHKHDERYSKHLGMNILETFGTSDQGRADQWYVEIHGTLRTGLSARIDKEVDANQRDVFYGGQVRSWNNGNALVFLPAPDNDVFFVFTHFIKHFYKEGLGLRQVCDWCRLLWTYRDKVNASLLEKRLRRSGLMSEWRGFAAFAVEYLGMPSEAMPFLDVRGKLEDGRREIDRRWKRKADQIMELILSGYSGNKYRDTLRIARIYPLNTMKFLPGILWNLNWLKVKERLLP